MDSVRIQSQAALYSNKENTPVANKAPQKRSCHLPHAFGKRVKAVIPTWKDDRLIQEHNDLKKNFSGRTFNKTRAIHHKWPRSAMIEFEKAILEWDLSETSFKKIKSAMGLKSDESILCWRPNLVLGPLSDKRVNDPGSKLDLNKRHGELTLRSKSIAEIFKVIHDGQPISDGKINKICHLLSQATAYHKQKVGSMTLDMDTSMWAQVIGKKPGYTKQECSRDI